MNAFFSKLFRRHVGQKGFTLVELMVVVAIIGLLSAVAIPNFKKYQAKSKTSEAKLQLSAAYAAQTSFFMDYDTYATCLEFMGYDPSDEAASRYYAVGHKAAVGTLNTAASKNGATGCPTAATFQYEGGKGTGDTTKAVVAKIPATTVTATTFEVSAAGSIAPGGATFVGGDQWQINELKKVSHERIGY